MHCVNPGHLYLGDAKDNAKDASDRKRWAYGERNWMNKNRDKFNGAGNHNSKLNEEQVKKIRELAKLGMRRKAIAEKFGIGQTTVYEIINNQAWQNI